MRKSVNSLQVSKPSGSYSQVLKVGDFVYISSQSGLDVNNKVVVGLKNQADKIFENTNILLSELKMHINQVVKTVVYAKEGVDMSVVDDIFEVNFKHPYPARSVVFVNGFKDEATLVEISFDAIDLSAYEAMQGCSDEGCDGCDDTDCEQA